MRFSRNEEVQSEKAWRRRHYLKEHLIQINIVGINGLYSDSLHDYYFRKISKDRDQLPGMHPAEKNDVNALVDGGGGGGLP